jgi:ABC-type Fe3+-hydroxamate transport system substrate-binding protein
MNTKVLLQLAQNIVKDQIGNTLLVTHPPQRIICLVPSITELLFHLGLGNRVVGITKFCIHPTAWFTTKERIGGTKNVNLKKVMALQPDLIIANKEENVKEQIDALAKTIPVYTSDINNLETALQMIAAIGKLTHTVKKAASIVTKIEKNFAGLSKLPTPKKVIYLIWRNPYITIGGDTFIHDMLHKMGLGNCYAKEKRYPTITTDALKKKKPEWVFLSSEPYPFKEKHIAELQELLPTATIILVDGELFSWYGSKLIKSPQYFKKLMKKK